LGTGEWNFDNPDVLLLSKWEFQAPSGRCRNHVL